VTVRADVFLVGLHTRNQGKELDNASV
jgi:hypothetical protein